MPLFPFSVDHSVAPLSPVCGLGDGCKPGHYRDSFSIYHCLHSDKKIWSLKDSCETYTEISTAVFNNTHMYIYICIYYFLNSIKGFQGSAIWEWTVLCKNEFKFFILVLWKIIENYRVAILNGLKFKIILHCWFKVICIIDFFLIVWIN